MLENTELQNILVLDIETVPQYPSFGEVPELFQELWDQKTMKLRSADQSAAEYYQRAGIWAEFGKIVCISVGIFTKHEGRLQLRVKSFAGHDECTLLGDFIALLDKQPASLTLCAHNGKEFDFPYLCRRTLINQLCIPSQLLIHGKKPWEVNHLDTMDLWKFGDYKNFTSLNLLAAIFNIPTPKDDIDGSDVHRVYWEEKNLERIITYCQKDVVTTAQLLLRFKGMGLLGEEQITIV
ncbi:3'-5' exonuclease [Pedobacter sp. SYSU D00535]|uniref:3'-5' exonuclease n=1 Tax=Pedobacter sp. SYSU D00535 TaxID=2810308 RepID=UPI001A975EEF|nr:3'-5' exonuclease [Pedobacter sp. SYSU D00535]